MSNGKGKPPHKPTETMTKTKKIYGHYMGCYVAGAGAIQYHALNGLMTLDAPADVRGDPSLIGDWAQTSYGGAYRNLGLAPQARSLSLMEAAELEIRRAIRIGMDGFTFDAWAGNKGARDLMDAMFEICESKDLPFELTVTLDTNAMNSTDPDIAIYPGNKWEKTIGWLLDKHGDSPKLARRDGKPLIMGYQSIWPGLQGIYSWLDANHPEYTDTERKQAVNDLRRNQQGWSLIADAYASMEKTVGQSIYWEFCMYSFFDGAGSLSSGIHGQAATYLASRFPALGAFTWEPSTPEIAAAAVAAGAEWSQPMKLQYENYGWYQLASPGLDWVRGDWEQADQYGCTLIQHITWNDYHESTNLSPGYNTRYAYYDLTGELIKAWKAGNGTTLSSDKDKVYVFSHKYTNDAPMWPFKAKTRADNVIEVFSILTSPAKMRVPGRTATTGESEWDAPAGVSFKKFPLTAGEVSVEWSRDGFVNDVNKLVLPDPVSDKPFRQDTGKTAISNQDSLHWAEDFPSDPYFVYSEYGDDDGDGLPNWFEMLWYGKFGTIGTDTVADPKADPNQTGRKNINHYLKQTDPYKVLATPDPIPSINLTKLANIQASFSANETKGEGLAKLTDGNPYTKCLHFNKECSYIFDFGSQVFCDKIAIISANDYPERDPQTIRLYSDEENFNWVLEKEWLNVAFDSRYQRKEFLAGALQNTARRWKIQCISSGLPTFGDTGSGILQMAELEFWGQGAYTDPTPTPTPDPTPTPVTLPAEVESANKVILNFKSTASPDQWAEEKARLTPILA